MTTTLSSPHYKLAYYRRLRRMTVEELAAKVGISAWTIRSYEQGRRRPRLDVAERLQDALGVRLVRAPRRARSRAANSHNGAAVAEFPGAQTDEVS